MSSNVNKKTSHYLVGDIKKVMLKTTLAMLAGTLAMSGYNLVDAYFVGQLPGDVSLAAMGYTFPIVMFVACLFRGLNIGVMTTVAHSLGAKKHKKAAKLTSYGVLIVACVSVLIGIIGMFSVNSILPILGAEKEALELSQGYMLIWFFGCLTASLTMLGNDMLISCGDNKVASLMMILGMLVNTALDPLFIFKFGMGIKGAAIATIISQFLVAVIVWVIVHKRHKLLYFKNMKLRNFKTVTRTVTHYAIPGTIGMLLMPIGSAVLTKITAEFGNAAVAAVAALTRLEMLAFVIPMALGISLMPMVAQNFGAKYYERIWQCRRFAMRFAIFFLMIMAIIFFFSAESLASFFTTDETVRKILTRGLQIVPWGFAGVEVHRFAGFFYTGCGHPRKTAYLSALRIVVFLIPFSLIALYYDSITLLFVARLFAEIFSGICGYILSRNLTNNLRGYSTKR